MRIFVTGSEGQVARSLKEAAARDPEVVVAFGSRPDLDLTLPDTIEPLIAAFEPDIVVNPAAYTAVDRAETEPELAYAINRDGAGAVAAAAANAGVPILQLSTDYVFNGAKAGSYKEWDAVDPQGIYGRSKLEGELAVAEANSKYIILRTAWIYAPFGTNFLRTMLRLGGERDQLRVVDDQIGCPTYAPALAEAILAVSRKIHRDGWDPSYAGVTHAAGSDKVTWCNFARMIMSEARARGARSAQIEAITSADYPTPARRPANSCLDTTRLATLFDIQMPSLAASLTDCLDRLLNVSITQSRNSLP